MKQHDNDAIIQSIKAYEDARSAYCVSRPDPKDATPHPLERQYLNVLHLLKDDDYSVRDTSRTGIETRRLPFGAQLTVAFAGPLFLGAPVANPNHMPAFTHRTIWWRGALAEALWMWRGDTSLQRLDAIQPGASTLWEDWAITGDSTWQREGPHVGRAYGYQFAHKLPAAIEKIRESPDTRRACFSLMEEADRPFMALECCHGCWIQFRSLPQPNSERRLLYLDMTQRSADWMLGVPFNVLAYYFLLRVVAAYLDQDMGGLKLDFNDAHIYTNHLSQASAIYPSTTYRPPLLHFKPFPALPTEEGLATWRAMTPAQALGVIQMDWFTIDSMQKYVSLPNMKMNVAV